MQSLIWKKDFPICFDILHFFLSFNYVPYLFIYVNNMYLEPCLALRVNFWISRKFKYTYIFTVYELQLYCIKTRVQASAESFSIYNKCFRNEEEITVWYPVIRDYKCIFGTGCNFKTYYQINERNQITFQK